MTVVLPSSFSQKWVRREVREFLQLFMSVGWSTGACGISAYHSAVRLSRVRANNRFPLDTAPANRSLSFLRRTISVLLHFPRSPCHPFSRPFTELVASLPSLTPALNTLLRCCCGFSQADARVSHRRHRLSCVPLLSSACFPLPLSP